MDSPMNVNWSIILVLKESSIFLKHVNFFALSIDTFDIFVIPFVQISQTCNALIIVIVKCSILASKV